MPKDRELMSLSHPRWEEFVERLSGQEGCNFRERRPGDPSSLEWDCRGGWDQGAAYAILCSMGLTHAAAIASLEFFAANGGHCDCEIIFNVDA
jgi:hypothetical protein